MADGEAITARAATPISGLVYDQLRAIAHARMIGERNGHALQTTALVHEALLKLTQDGQIRLEDRPGFFRAAATAMRQILIDHARAASRLKRGGPQGKRVRFDVTQLNATVAFEPEQVLAVDEALTRLEAHDPRSAEIVRLRFFAGLTMDEAAAAAGVSLRTAERLWTYARAWLWRALSADDA
jgi:RNA polymerase sigma factor (TIGR02999 family)